MKPVGVSTPAWSFVGKKEAKHNPPYVPGPGAHSISTGEQVTWDRAPTWVFGTSGRTDWTGGNVNPGPGEYFDGDIDPNAEETKAKKESTKLKIGIKDSYGNGKKHFFGYMGRSENCNKNAVPGPGSYQHKLVAKEPQKYSFGYKFSSKEFECDNPLGPGQYYVEHTQQESRRVNKFGSEKRGNMYKTQQTPGSNKYYPQELRSHSSTKGTFGKARREGIYKDCALLSPGPAAYKLKNYTMKETMDKNKGFSIASKGGSSQSTANSTPGPGEYNPTTIKTKKFAPQYRFGSSLRPDLNIDYTKAPGPGTYYRDADMMNIEERQHMKGPKIKDPFFLPNKTLGPDLPTGEKFQEWEGYLHKVGDFNTQPKYSFSGKRDGASKRGEYKTPGPGAYDPWPYDPDNDQRIEGRTPIIGTSMRPNLDKRNNVPGPGHYYAQDQKLGS